MKKYLLFTFEQYYPRGGMNDFEGSYATIEEAKERFVKLKSKCQYGQIVEHETMKIVVEL